MKSMRDGDDSKSYPSPHGLGGVVIEFALGFIAAGVLYIAFAMEKKS